MHCIPIKYGHGELQARAEAYEYLKANTDFEYNRNWLYTDHGYKTLKECKLQESISTNREITYTKGGKISARESIWLNYTRVVE